MKHLLTMALAVSAAASAATFPPLERRPVLNAELPPANPPVRLVRGVSIRFAPGQPTGRHRHPASVVGIVTDGSFIFQPAGEPRRILRTGDSFFEPAGHAIEHFDNASPDRPAAITAFYLTDTADRPAIEMLPPG